MDLEYIQQQVDGQVKWNATESEMRDWLKSKHGIEGDTADQIIEKAFHAKSGDIKSTAKVHFTIYAILSLILATLVILAFMGGGRRGTTFIMLAGLITTLGLAAKSLKRLITGKGDHKADFVED